MKCSAYYFHIKTKILTDFQICISVPLNKLIRNRLPLLQSDPKMKMIFLEKSIKGIYKRGKNVTEILSPSSFPSTKNLIFGLIGNCNKRCDICTNFMVFDTTFNCTETVISIKLKELYLLTVSMWYIQLLVSVAQCSMLDQLLLSKKDFACIKVT